MRTRKLTDVRNDIFLIIGQVTVFILSIAFIIYIYTHNIAPDKRVAEEFTATSCTIIDKDIAIVGRVMHRYRAEFKVQYPTTNGSSSAIASANGMDFSYSTNREAQQEYIDEFETGSIYPCWYDPQKPAIVVLVLRHNWTSTLPLFFPTLIAFIMFFYIIKSTVDLIETYLYMKQKKRR